MAQAAVLKYTKVVKTTGLSAMKFDLDGFLVEFTLNSIKFRHVIIENFRSEDQETIYASGGYFQEQKFLEYLAKDITPIGLQEYKLKEESLERATTGDTIEVLRLKIVAPFTDFCKALEYSWSYVATTPILDDYFNIIIPAGVNPTTTTKAVDSNASLFYTNKVTLFVNSSQSENDKIAIATLLAKIALVIDRINKDVFVLFLNQPNTDFNTYINSQNLEWTTMPIFENPTIEDFEMYLAYLKVFYEGAFSNQIVIQKAPNEKKLYWLAYSLSEDGLKVISAYDKLKILGIIAVGTLKGESNTIFGGINEEKFVLKIVKSVLQSQIDAFLTGLLTVYYNNTTNDDTLFKVLYDKVNDVGIGSENLKELMNALYQKWLFSSFYPYNLNGTVKDILINPTTYQNKAISINYEAGDFLWIFNTTNYDFDFNNEQIDVIEDGFEINPVTGNAIPREFTIGSYNLFQAITVKNTDANTENTKFITIGAENEQKAVMPIFYLKYIDDKKFTENLFTAAELTFDLALTATGIGNLAKLRHLKHLTPFGRVALGLEAPGANLIRYELAQGVAGIIEVSSTLASALLNYGNTYNDTYCNIQSGSYNEETCNLYKRLNTIATVLQIFSGGLDYLTSRQLRRASREILAGPIPNDFDPQALILLQKFAGNIAEMKEVFRVKLFQLLGDNPTIWQKLNDLPTSPINKQEMFIVDFERAPNNILTELNVNNGELINYWVDVEYFLGKRKEIGFLKDVKKIKNSFELDIEVFKGRSGKKLKKVFENLPPPHPNNHYTWEAKGVHHKEALQTFGTGGKGRIVPNTKNDVGPQGFGYYTAKVEVYNSEFPDNGGWKVKNSKGGISTFFPDNWSKQRLQEELSIAYKNKKYRGNNKYESKLSDGVKIRFHINNGLIETVYPIF